MSWDIFVQDLTPDAPTIEAIPPDFVPRPLGLRADITAAILAVVPYANFTDPAWGQIDASAFSIEVNLGANELVDSFALHVRGGDATVTCVAAILDALVLRAIYASSGDFFNGNTALESFQRWRRYRRRIMASDS